MCAQFMQLDNFCMISHAKNVFTGVSTVLRMNFKYYHNDLLLLCRWILVFTSASAFRSEHVDPAAVAWSKALALAGNIF